MSDYDIYFDWEKSSDDLPERYKPADDVFMMAIVQIL